MSEYLVHVSTQPMFAQEEFTRISPLVFWTTSTSGPLSSLTALMRPRNFSPITESGRLELSVLV